MSEHPNDGLDNKDSEFSLEVAPLAPPPDSGAQTAPVSRLLRWKRMWRTIIVTGTLILTLALLVGGYPPARNTLVTWFSPRPTTTSLIEPTVALLGKVPTNCPPGNSLATISPAWGQGIPLAAPHVWLKGFDGPISSLRFAEGTAPTAHGWPRLLGLVAAPDVTQSITLRVIGIGDTAGSVLFSTNGLGNTVASLTLDPSSTSPQEDGWRVWLFYLLVPSAGCYYLDAGYGGSQTSGVFFAAGAQTPFGGVLAWANSETATVRYAQ